MTDRFTVRAVVIGLFVLGLAFGGGIIYLSAAGHDHGVLDNLTAVVVGALAGVLSRTNTEVQPVAVVDQPVATTDVPAPAKRKRSDRGDAAGALLWVILVVALACLLGLTVHHWFFLLLLFVVLAVVLV